MEEHDLEEKCNAWIHPKEKHPKGELWIVDGKAKPFRCRNKAKYKVYPNDDKPASCGLHVTSLRSLRRGLDIILGEEVFTAQPRCPRCNGKAKIKYNKSVSRELLWCLNSKCNYVGNLNASEWGK